MKIAPLEISRRDNIAIRRVTRHSMLALFPFSRKSAYRYEICMYKYVLAKYVHSFVRRGVLTYTIHNSTIHNSITRMIPCAFFTTTSTIFYPAFSIRRTVLWFLFFECAADRGLPMAFFLFLAVTDLPVWCMECCPCLVCANVWQGRREVMGAVASSKASRALFSMTRTAIAA